MIHPFINATTPYTDREQLDLGGYKAGGGPADFVPEVVGTMRLKAKLRQTTKFEHKVFDDDAAAPRPFWHVRAVLGGEDGSTTTEWFQYGDLGDHKLLGPGHPVAAEHEEKAFAQLFGDICTALDLDDF